MPTAARQLVAMLCRLEVDRVFCVPGESYLPVLDALADEPAIDLVTCRHESGAGLMAVADAKMTDRPGVAFVSRGPGATNAALAVHTAEQDGAPMVLVIGQLPRENLERGVFQKVDYERTFADMAKQVVEVHDAQRLAEAVAEAFRVATDETPGPVVISVPEDVFDEQVGDALPKPSRRSPATPAPDEVRALAERLDAATRPLLLVGGLARSARGRAALAACVDRWQVPVATSYKHQDLFDNHHPCFAGHLGFGLPPLAWQHLTDADLIVAVGTRLNEITTQRFRLPKAPTPDQPLVHVHSDRSQIGRVFETTVGIVADAIPFLEALAARTPTPTSDRTDRTAWRDRVHTAFLELAHWTPSEAPDGVDFGYVVAALGDQLPSDAVLAMDAGNFGGWLHRHFLFRSSHLLLGAISGGMGLGAPAAVAAALRYPSRQVVSVIGDGGFLMTGNELATAVQYGARVRLFVANNRSYGTIRLHQEKLFPGRVAGTDLTNPDFAAMGEAFGARGLVLDTPGDTAAVVREALGHDGPVVVDVRTSLEHLSTFSTLTSLAAPSS
ncbi:MAG: thiamine pyrophosphate-binding protein [Vicinamibacterales bacterium]|jgi:acetolactate synthase-1/2/3 large subunit|nr:thiamine pyrophosphate-binding protein [Vicinamibacterales bacterium]MDP7478058.1 thiamine pyrophosphate-binding protein [Vicinamibacterales bacterium]MDP7691018.1 thiamine pyrophosphate-binding protein [Vicinamibacterales bacterium]HJN46295.1 thiamine pyrophosphate-binding protein [Vicinamibacterales bacterium]